jgi:hypothetical protein
MRDLFYALSQETIYYRFMSRSKQVPRSEIQDFVFIDHRSDVAIVCTVPEAHGEDIIAIGRYYLDERTNMAEVAFVVRDDWQNRGIGTPPAALPGAQVAVRNGIRGFTAEVLRANRAMQRVFHKTDYRVTSAPQDDVYSFVIEFQCVGAIERVGQHLSPAVPGARRPGARSEAASARNSPSESQRRYPSSTNCCTCFGRGAAGAGLEQAAPVHERHD